MANGISKNPLTDISKVYLNQIAEGSLKSLEKASVLAMSDDPKDQDKAREIKTRFDYQSLMKQKKAKKMKEDAEFTEVRSNWRHDLSEIITTDKSSEEPEIKEKKIKNKITINPKFNEAVEKLGGKLLTVEEVEEDPKKAEQIKKKEKMLKKRMLMMKLRAVNQDAGGDVTAGYEPEGDMVEAKYERGASDYGKMSIRNKRAVGYGGNAAPPEERRKAHDERMKKHKASQMKEEKHRDAALDAVKKSIIAKYGKGAIMRKGSNQQKKVRGAKSTAGTGKYKKMADDKKQLKKDAKEMGYGSDTKGYVETRARYGSKENMKSGRGLGT